MEDEFLSLVENLLCAETIEESELLEVNYKLRKLVERLISTQHTNPEVMNLYYLLADNYQIIRRDPNEGLRNLRILIPRLHQILLKS